MRIAIGADHAGFTLKEHLKQTLTRLGHAVDDHGTTSEASVDYPPICLAVGRAVAEGRVLSMGGRIVAFGLADEILALWLNTAFEGGRHQRRIDQISEAERSRP